MAYQTYNTEAVICGVWDRNTADRSYLLFTRDAGMLYADAKSARLERSKQRCALQEFSRIKVSLVRGKGGWRVASVEAVANPFLAALTRPERGVVVKVTQLLRRFVHGEEVIPQVYADLEHLFADLPAIATHPHCIPVFTLRMLYHLGYVAREPWNEAALNALTLTEALAEPINEALLTRAIDTASSSSQL